MPRKTDASERRREQRKRPLSLIYVELTPSNGGMMRDLSEKGFAMRAMMPLRIGETTPFAFSLNASTRLEGKCKVHWVEEDGRVAGLQFTEVNRELLRHVRSWLDREQEHAATPAHVSNTAEPSNSSLQLLREELRTVQARPEISGFPGLQEAAVPPAISETHAHPEDLVVAETIAVVEAPAPEVFIAPAPGLSVAPAPEFCIPPALEALVIPAPELSETAIETPDEATVEVPVLEPAVIPIPEPPSEVSFLQLPGLPDVELPSESTKPAVWMDRSLVSLGVRMMLLFALLAVAFVYHRQVGNAIVWLGLKIAGTPSAEVLPSSQNDSQAAAVAPAISSTPAAPALGAPDNEAASSPSLASASPATSEGEHNEVSPTQGKNAAEAVAKPENKFTLPARSPSPASTAAMLPVTRSTTAPPAAAAGVEPGQSEFLAAQDILKKNDGTGLQEAVRLLWVAVEKGNPSAEVALAELYRGGKGVARNCDQAKILLGAAARKGNTQAKQLLNDLQGEGCE